MGLLTVKASGQHLTVDIQTTAAHEAATFSDEALTTPITLPLAITADQDFYFRPGEAVVDVTVTTAAGVVLMNAERHVIGTVDRVVLTPLPTPAQEAATDSASTGGSLPVGVPVIRAFPIAFDDVGLSDGLGIYTPAVGDVLLDAWIQIDAAWNGTTPLGDVGTFSDTYGWLAYLAGPCDMTRVDGLNSLDAANLKTQLTGGPSTDLLLGSIQSFGTAQYRRHIPAVFLTTDPVKICVSADGTTAGADPAASAGSGVVYLKTCTPLVGSTF